MEKLILRLLKCLRIELAIFFIIVAAIAFLAVSDNLVQKGNLAGKEFIQTRYILDIVTIAVTFIGIWAALKLFRLNTTNSLKRYTLDDAVKTYHAWSIGRVVILLLVIALGMANYILTLSDTGLYAAAIALLITLIFCIPSYQKITAYLQKSQQEKD